MKSKQRRKSSRIGSRRWDRTVPIWTDWRSKCQRMTDDEVGYWITGCFLLIGWIKGWDGNKKFLERMHDLVEGRTSERRQRKQVN